MLRSAWNGMRMLRDPSSCPHRNWAQFHSTPSSFAKRGAKVVHTSKDQGTSARLSKDHVRFFIRQKRADAKRALNDFLLKGSYIKKNVQSEWGTWYSSSKRSQHIVRGGFMNDFNEKSQSNHSGRFKFNRRSLKKTQRNGKKCKRWTFVTDDEETTFEATFGEKRYTWVRPSRTNFRTEGPTAGFNWRDDTYWFNGSCSGGTREHIRNSNSTNKRKWESGREFDSEEESESDLDSEEENMNTEASLGLSPHRMILGLPPTGPLRIDEIKTAFRASAMKWHPDKHHGASQVMAGEKFKLCVEAYNSLCSSLTSSRAVH